jgi:hypothetical protein
MSQGGPWRRIRQVAASKEDERGVGSAKVTALVTGEGIGFMTNVTSCPITCAPSKIASVPS